MPQLNRMMRCSRIPGAHKSRESYVGGEGFLQIFESFRRELSVRFTVVFKLQKFLLVCNSKSFKVCQGLT